MPGAVKAAEALLLMHGLLPHSERLACTPLVCHSLRLEVVAWFTEWMFAHRLSQAHLLISRLLVRDVRVTLTVSALSYSQTASKNIVTRTRCAKNKFTSHPSLVLIPAAVR